MLKPLPRHCPVCDSPQTEVVGPILHPEPALVAGVPLDLGDSPFALRRCSKCGFQFKDPGIDPKKLLDCYAAADSGNWGESPDPRQRKFDILRDTLAQFSPGLRILEVGCFNGAMLEFFGDHWERYGVEPAKAAVELANRRGVTILADTLDNVNGGAETFDAILAIDVLEHVVDPLPFFRRVSELLKPSGVFIVVTGNTKSLAWRMQGSMFWYCSLPEHVSFYDRQSIDELGRLSGLECIEFRELCHKRLPVTRWVSDMLKSTAYVLGRSTGGLGIAPLRRLFVERRGPSIQSAKDHFLGVLRKVG